MHQSHLCFTLGENFGLVSNLLWQWAGHIVCTTEAFGVESISNGHHKLMTDDLLGAADSHWMYVVSDELLLKCLDDDKDEDFFLLKLSPHCLQAITFYV